MALLKYLYLRKEGPMRECSALSKRETEQVNERMKQVLVTAGKKHSPTRGSYADYTPEDRAKIGKYATENGPARATRHFSVPETTARRLKTEYLQKLKTICFSENTVPVVKSLPTKTQGRPLLLGLKLDQVVQNYVNALRTVGGVVNTAIVMAAAEGVVSARDAGLLVGHGGHIDITKTWAKSLLRRMGYVNRKCSSAGKITASHFESVREAFLADVMAEVVMNDIPRELIFNWDQTALNYVPTGE